MAPVLFRFLISYPAENFVELDPGQYDTYEEYVRIVGRGRKLRINYRTTEENRKWAVNLLKGVQFDDLDGGEDKQKGYKSLVHGIAPEVVQLSSFKDEIEYIEEHLGKIEEQGGNLSEVCLVARTHSLLKQYEGALKSRGFEIYFIKRSEAEDRRQEGLRLSTMHRVKGLEFEFVIIAGVNEGILPQEVEWSRSSDRVIRREGEKHEKALLYVAATRARQEVLVTSFDKASRFLQI